LLVVAGVSLLLTMLASNQTVTSARGLVAGALVGLALALKLTVGFVIPGLAVLLVALVCSGRRAAAFTFTVAATAAAAFAYAPWAFAVNSAFGSPLFPFFNAVFQAPRYPIANFHDRRFGADSVNALIQLPMQQADGSSPTSEIAFSDPRWAVGWLAARVIALVVLRAARRVDARDGMLLPVAALAGFWVASYVAWAIGFGIQRYAIVLEVLAIPLILAALACLVPLHYRMRQWGMAVAILAVVVATQTRVPDFGHLPMTANPMVPQAALPELARYDAIVVGTPPLAYLRAIARGDAQVKSQLWLGAPFNDADRSIARIAIAGMSIGVVYYPSELPGALYVANSLRLGITSRCKPVHPPITRPYTNEIVVCDAIVLET
jgi:hypothetical protein